MLDLFEAWSRVHPLLRRGDLWYEPLLVIGYKHAPSFNVVLHFRTCQVSFLDFSQIADLLERLHAPREIVIKYRKHVLSLLSLTWPNVLTFFVSLSIPFSSSLYVGHLGPEYLAASALGNMIANAFGFAIGSGLSMALDTLCSQAYGAKKYKLVGLHCQRMMVILTLVSLPLAVIWLQTEWVLKLVGMPPKVAVLSAFWVKLLLPGMLPRFLFECLRRYTLSQKRVWPVTLSVGITAVFHITNTGLFVYYFGFGYWGAALSASISNWILFLSLLSLTLIRHRKTESKAIDCPPSLSSSSSSLSLTSSTASLLPQSADAAKLVEEGVSTAGAAAAAEAAAPSGAPIPREPSTHVATDDEDSTLSSNESIKAILSKSGVIKDLPINVETEHDTWPSPWTLDLFRGWGDILRLGAPSACSLFLEWGSYEVTAAFAGQLGTIPLATHVVLSNTAGLWYQVPTGFAVAASTLIGNALGAGEAENAKRAARVAYVFEALWGLVNGAVFTLALRNVWGAAFSSDWRVVQMTAYLMPVMWCYGFWDAIKCVGMACLRGCGRPDITVWGNLISCLVIGYPMCALLTFGLNLELPGLWAGMTCSWLCAGITYGYVLYYTDWQEEVAKAELRNMRALSTIEHKAPVMEPEGL